MIMIHLCEIHRTFTRPPGDPLGEHRQLPLLNLELTAAVYLTGACVLPVKDGM